MCGIDLRAPYAGVDLPNLRFLQGDLLDPAFASTIPSADFVFSIECLEHIRDDRSVFAKIAALVSPGGLLYVEVPFATELEQADPAVCRREFETFEHVRPGYSAKQLDELSTSHGLVVERIAGAFWFPVQPMTWLAIEKLGQVELEPHWRTLHSIAKLDRKEGVPLSRAEATAISLLARRPHRSR